MKKFLPNIQKTNKSFSGFTLIELLIVVAIIAVLAVMGFAAFRGFTGKGNDARREADLKAIGDALESGKAGAGTTTYPQLTNNLFASGVIPVDPGSKVYCMSSIASAGSIGIVPTVNTHVWTTAAATACIGAGTAGEGADSVAAPTWSTVNSSTPVAGALRWMVCAYLDAAGTTGSQMICRASAQ